MDVNSEHNTSKRVSSAWNHDDKDSHQPDETQNVNVPDFNSHEETRMKPQSLNITQRKTVVEQVTNYTYHLFNGDLPGSQLTQWISIIFILNICLSFINSAAQTVKEAKYTPSHCFDPACNDHPDFCPGRMICAPVSFPVYGIIDDICVYIFTFEYLIILVTYWAVSNSEDEEISSSAKTQSDGIFIRYLRYIIRFQNVIDLACILPYWISLGQSGQQSQAVVFLRIFRILRVFKLIRYSKKPQQMMELVAATLSKSLPALGVLSLFMVLKMIFFGSIIYSIEQGKFTVNEDYPDGEYLRASINGRGLEVSPFNSIPTSIYWVVTTGTTVGYGDLAPTSWVGRMIANIVMIMGVLVLALPIGVVGSNFTQLYTEQMQLDWKNASNVMDVDSLDEKQMIELFHSFDDNKSGSISQEEFKLAFRSAGVDGSDAFYEAIFNKADDDGTGEISEEEFIIMCKKMQVARRGMSVDNRVTSKVSPGTPETDVNATVVANEYKVFPFCTDDEDSGSLDSMVQKSISISGDCAGASGLDQKSSKSSADYNQNSKDSLGSSIKSPNQARRSSSKSSRKVEAMRQRLLAVRQEIDQMLSSLTDEGSDDE